MSSPKHTTEAVSAAIRAELARRNLQVTDLRVALGIRHHTSWHRRMRGETSWTVDEMAAVAAWIGVPLSALVPADVEDVPA